MREHKYRAWSKRYNKMCEVDEIHFNTKTINVRYNNHSDWVGITTEKWVRRGEPLDEFILIQYIERKDKNNIEIYESDILKDNYGRILLVEWYKHGFSFKAITEANFLRARDISQWFEYVEDLPEIIGNVLKNPELMEATDQ